MKTYLLNDIDLLITELYSHPHQTIVIDGEDGVGKSYRIAPRIANVLGSSIIHLDEYLVSPSDSYELNLERLAGHVTESQKKGSLIVEGVMAIKTAKSIQLTPSAHIYVEGSNCRNTWTHPDGRYQKKSLQEILLYEEQQLRQVSPDSRLTTFRKEVIEYHFDFRPFEKADYKLIVE